MKNFYFLRIMCTKNDTSAALKKLRRCGFTLENITAKKIDNNYILTGTKQILNGRDFSRWIEYTNGIPADVANLDKIRAFCELAAYGDPVKIPADI